MSSRFTDGNIAYDQQDAEEEGDSPRRMHSEAAPKSVDPEADAGKATIVPAATDEAAAVTLDGPDLDDAWISPPPSSSTPASRRPTVRPSLFPTLPPTVIRPVKD